MSDRPFRLTIAIPAYNRPDWLGRALRSILTTPVTQHPLVQIVVSDDSPGAACRPIVESLLENWQGSWHYQANTPSLGMAANWNNCARLAQGDYVLILHDDDYLEPGGAAPLLAALLPHSHPPQDQRQPPGSVAAFLFGVKVVNPKGQVLKRQTFARDHYLPPTAALTCVLTHSSFIRFPGIVLRRDVFETVGYFDETIGGFADVHMWVRVLQRYGLMCVATTAMNYTVHPDALTMGMFNWANVQQVLKVFQTVEDHQWLDKDTLATCRTNYLHQFILAGTVRQLRLRQFTQAKAVMGLFDQVPVSSDRAFLKWKLIKVALTLILAFF